MQVSCQKFPPLVVPLTHANNELFLPAMCCSNRLCKLAAQPGVNIVENSFPHYHRLRCQRIKHHPAADMVSKHQEVKSNGKKWKAAGDETMALVISVDLSFYQKNLLYFHRNTCNAKQHGKQGQHSQPFRNNQGFPQFSGDQEMKRRLSFLSSNSIFRSKTFPCW